MMIILSGKFPIYIKYSKSSANARKKYQNVNSPKKKLPRFPRGSCRSLLILLFLAAIFAQPQLSSCINLQLLGGIKQADRNGSCLCLLASAVNMHGIGFLIDDKIADRQDLSSWLRAIRFYYAQYFLLSYNYIINSIFVNANPQQDFS